MSKHPTRDLSQRDMACIMYGKEYRAMEAYCGNGLMGSIPLKMKESRAAKRNLIKQLREMRACIFRTCDECAHEDVFDCTVRNERLCDCYGYKDYAPTCPHYKERGEA